MSIKAYRTLPQFQTVTHNVTSLDRELIDLLMNEPSMRWERITRELEEIAHDLDAACPCGTCNVVRNIAARYT